MIIQRSSTYGTLEIAQFYKHFVWSEFLVVEFFTSLCLLCLGNS